MPFFQTQEAIQKTTPIDIDYVRATTLRNAVTRKASAIRPWRHSAWADEFRLLRQEVAKAPNPADIDLVLNHYIANIGKPQYPNITTAATFRKLFDWCVRLAAQRVFSPINISEECKAIASQLYERLRRRNWEKGSSYLYDSLVISVHNHTGYIRALHPCRDHKQIGRFVQWFWPRVNGSGFLYNWYLDIWSQVVKWSEWSGTFKAFGFDPERERFYKIGVAWATEYGDRSLWAEVCEQTGFTYLPEDKP